MPTASRNERRKRRQRRNISLITRELRSLNARHFNASFTLLAVLKYMDGPITISKELAATLMQEYHFLSWQADRQSDGSVIVTLQDKRTAKADETVGATSDAADGVSPRSVTAQLGKRTPCTQCGGAGVITRDTLVGGTDHDTEDTPCDHCKDTEGYEPDEAPDAQRPA